LSDPIEDELLRQAQAGDYLAFEDLLNRLDGPVRRFVRRLIGDGLVEDDVVQMTFISLYRNLSRIDPVETLRPYLFRIARNRCYDELRRQGRFELPSLDDEAVEMRVSFTSASGDHSEPEDVVHWLLLHLEVQQAMDWLPELQRQALIMYSEENLTYEEIAVAMDTTIGTVKSRLYHARQTLRRLLKPETVTALQAAFAAEENTQKRTIAEFD